MNTWMACIDPDDPIVDEQEYEKLFNEWNKLFIRRQQELDNQMEDKNTK
jgi:hypothetical protein